MKKIFILFTCALLYNSCYNMSYEQCLVIKDKLIQKHPNETALFEAINQNDIKTVKELLPIVNVNIKNYANDTFLIRAADFGWVEIVKLLLEIPDIKIDETGIFGATALTTVARTRLNNDVSRKIIIKLLLNANADINILSTKSYFAQSFASYMEQDELSREAYQEYLKEKKQN